MSSTKPHPTPISDPIIVAVSRMVDDAQSPREPSHSDIDFQINRAALAAVDPKTLGQSVGKAKRVRAVLSWALDNNKQNGGHFVSLLIDTIKGFGGFRSQSTNYVGEQAIQNAQAAFANEGYELTLEGELRPRVLAGLSGAALTDALRSYVRRAQLGQSDAALVTGTGKDLLEATAAHVIEQKWGSYTYSGNFPTLLGQAFTALGLKTTKDARAAGEHPRHPLERAMYEAGCAVNTLRNKQGTGHGRPWLTDVSPEEARIAIQQMGVISEMLLLRLASKP